MSCAEGDEGFDYECATDLEVEAMDFSDLPETPTKVMLN